MARCELCKAEKKTYWYYEDDMIWIADCLTCNKPMVVFKRHKPKPSSGEAAHAEWIIKQLFGKEVGIRKVARKIQDHAHWHCFILILIFILNEVRF